MSPEERRRPARSRHTIGIPVVVLLASALLAGCGTDAEPAAPSFVGGSGTPPPATGTPVVSASPATPPPAVRQTPSPSATAGPYVFPVQTGNVSYHKTHSAYPATDIFANCGSPVVAVTNGRVLEVSRVDEFDENGPKGPLNGGKSVSLLGDDGVRYYGSHLVEVTAGIEAGVRVRAGQRIGSVGRTGNANNVCHLHFGISPPCQRTADWWIRRGVVWPAEFLDAWRKHVNRSPAAKVTAWQHDKGCPKAP
ncbi:peptidoglycan DD-metalloendopeptidase family protein [Micromonospora sp. NPDC049559]|uniref:M23 family metallopeptidase n=1 Tax=Micromonospora sp. NPDC049559 TaxID=3155923 RepID=UPI00341E6EB7